MKDMYSSFKETKRSDKRLLDFDKESEIKQAKIAFLMDQKKAC